MPAYQSYHRWTKEEEEWLQQNFETVLNEDLAKHFGVTIGSIKRKSLDLHLLKNEQWLRFISKKPNAGHFKKGSAPINTAFDGAIKVRTVKNGHISKWIRVEKNKWIELQHYNWKKAGNEIPEGFVLCFKSFNPLNAFNWDVSNLELKSRPVHLATNKKRKGSSPKPSKRLKRKLDKIREKILKKHAPKPSLKVANVEAQWAAQRKVAKQREERKSFKTKVVDYSQLISVRIDHRTVIYAKPGQDIEQVRNNYLAKFKKA